MGIISIEQMDRLYWLGRYSERVYTTLRFFAKSYDVMIDQAERNYESFCRQLEIPNIYISGDDFVRRYCFDAENPDSIYSNLMRAYDNAIVLREELGSETLSYIQLAMYDMAKTRGEQAPLIGFQRVMDNLMAFWGTVDDSISSENVRGVVKVGKRIERIDLYGRWKLPRANMQREAYRLLGRLPRTQLGYRKEALEELRRLVESEKLEYHKIVTCVENILKE